MRYASVLIVSLLLAITTVARVVAVSPVQLEQHIHPAYLRAANSARTQEYNGIAGQGALQQQSHSNCSVVFCSDTLHLEYVSSFVSPPPPRFRQAAWLAVQAQAQVAKAFISVSLLLCLPPLVHARSNSDSNNSFMSMYSGGVTSSDSETSDDHSSNWTLTQIVAPVIAGVSVALVALVLFLCYRRRRKNREVPFRQPTLPPLPYAYEHNDLNDSNAQPTPGIPPPLVPNRRPSAYGSATSSQTLFVPMPPSRESDHPSQRTRRPVRPAYTGYLQARMRLPGFLFGWLPGTKTVRSRTGRGRKDSDWEIDLEDQDASSSWSTVGIEQQSRPEQGPSTISSSSTAALNPGASRTHPYHFSPLYEDEANTGYFPPQPRSHSARTRAHAYTTSKSSLLSRSHVKEESSSSWLSRFGLYPYAAGVRKGPGYRSGRVRHADTSAGGIDIDMDSDGNEAGEESALSTRSQSRQQGQGHGPSSSERVARFSPAETPAQVPTPPDDIDDRRTLNPGDVLLISRVPGQDFELESSIAVG